MNKGYKSPKVARAVEIGVWVRPHPDSEMARMGHSVESVLYERPDDDCKPTHVIDEYEDFDTVGMAPVRKVRDVPFEEPTLGGGWTCAGCGEPFGQQMKIRRGLYMSRQSSAYYTDDPAFKWNNGLMVFCDDEYGCGKRAIDRVGDSAKHQLIRVERKKVAEVLDMKLDDIEDPLSHHRGRVLITGEAKPKTAPDRGPLTCRLQSCKKEFVPTNRTQAYCSPECAAVVKNNRTKAYQLKRKTGKAPGRPQKAAVEA